MTERFVLTIGLIPIDSSIPLIKVGDPDFSGTHEINFEIQNHLLTCVEHDFSLDCTHLDWFAIDSPIFVSLHTLIRQHLGRTLHAHLLAHAWAFFQWELDEEVPAITLICDEDDGACFDNFRKTLNGKFFARYYCEDNHEIFGERVIILDESKGF